MTVMQRRSLTAIIVVALGSAGCAAHNTDMLHFLRSGEHEVSASEYRLGIPDTINITAPNITEIDGEIARIQPDGKITLQLLGQVKIVGMTAKEIRAKLAVLASKYYVDPKIDVRVAGYASKKYYVYGHAGTPGPRSYTGRDTLLDAVLNAGVGPGSWMSRIKVIRPAHGETDVRILRVNVDRMIKKGDWSKNILLEPNDIVYIPPTPVAWFSERVAQILAPVSPVVQAYVAPAYVGRLDEVYKDGNNAQLFSGSGALGGGGYRP